eukprot:3381784-Prymnesium_polylepis.1
MRPEALLQRLEEVCTTTTKAAHDHPKARPKKPVDDLRAALSRSWRRLLQLLRNADLTESALV